jgi:hypothetical protein
LDEALREILDPGERWALGGGTILAAEWKHRATKDIDLKLEPGTREERLEPEQNHHYIATLQRLGAKDWQGNGKQLIVSFSDSLLDLFESRSRPKGAQVTRKVNGRRERLLSNAQILAGKLTGRGMLSPTKDVYDMAVARRADRRALEIAVNCLSRSTIEEIATRWEGLARYHQREAPRRLTDVPEGLSEIKADPAAHAVEAALDCRYRQVTLEWNQGELRLRTLTEDGEPRSEMLGSRTRTEIEQAAEEAGLADYIRRNTPFAVATIVDLAERTRNEGRREGTRTIWGTAPPVPPPRPGAGGTSGHERTRTPPRHRR